MSEGRRQWTGRAVLTLVSLLIGMAVGLFIGWEIRPARPIEATPADLQSSYKDDYIRMISAAYFLNGDLNAAKERLAQLGIADPVLVAGAVATRETRPGSNVPGSDAILKFVAALATAQRPTPSTTSTLVPSATASPTSTLVETVPPSPTPSLSPVLTAVASPSYTVTPTEVPTWMATAQPTSTTALDPSLTSAQQPTSTPTLEPTSTSTVLSPVAPLATAGPRAPVATETALPTTTETTSPTASATAAATATQPPTETPTLVPTAPLPTATFSPTPLPTLPPVVLPTQPAPGFQLVDRAMLTCLDEPEIGHLRFYVRDRSGRELPNVTIEIRWAGGEDTVYTGLKPERGVGYADFEAVPDTYTVAIANGGSDAVAGLLVANPPANCSSDRGATARGWKLTFQQK